jgi:hypothetical protein
MATKIKRSEFKSFMNTTPATTATYKLIGDGVTTATINYNPKTTEEQYISEDSASIYIDAYAPTMPVEMTAKNGDDVYEFVDGLRKARAILDDAETDIVNVWLYETATLGEYPAEKQACSIAIDDFGGDGGASVKVNYTINFRGDPVLGTFNPTTKVFTPNPNTGEGLSAFTIGALTLTPTFDRDQLFYTATTNTSPQTGTATAEDSGATVLLKNGGTTIDTDTGEATGAITLANGVNTITAKVTIGAVNNTYTIAVTKTA